MPRSGTPNTDSLVFTKTINSTTETEVGRIRVPEHEKWVLKKIWCSHPKGGNYRLSIISRDGRYSIVGASTSRSTQLAAPQINSKQTLSGQFIQQASALSSNDAIPNTQFCNANLLYDINLSINGPNEVSIYATNSDGGVATGIITIVDLGSDTTNINHLHGTTGFTLTDAVGTSKEYIFDKNNALGATGTVDAEGIVIQVNGMSAASDVANQVELAIEHSNGHNGSILVNRVSNVLNLTTQVGGASANVTIDPGSMPTPSYITFSGMSGGTDTGICKAMIIYDRYIQRGIGK